MLKVLNLAILLLWLALKILLLVILFVLAKIRMYCLVSMLMSLQLLCGFPLIVLHWQDVKVKLFKQEKFVNALIVKPLVTYLFALKAQKKVMLLLLKDVANSKWRLSLKLCAVKVLSSLLADLKLLCVKKAIPFMSLLKMCLSTVMKSLWALLQTSFLSEKAVWSIVLIMAQGEFVFPFPFQHEDLLVIVTSS